MILLHMTVHHHHNYGDNNVWGFIERRTTIGPCGAPYNEVMFLTHAGRLLKQCDILPEMPSIFNRIVWFAVLNVVI